MTTTAEFVPGTDPVFGTWCRVKDRPEAHHFLAGTTLCGAKVVPVCEAVCLVAYPDRPLRSGTRRTAPYCRECLRHQWARWEGMK